MTIEGIKCEVEILDIAGQDDYQTVLDTWIQNGNCYLLVYSIDDSERKINKAINIKNNWIF